MTNGISRRSFLQGLSGTAAIAAVPAVLVPERRIASASLERLEGDANWPVNAAVVESTGFLQVYRDATQPGGFNISSQIDIPVGFWDNKGTLKTVSGANSWVIYWFGDVKGVSVLTLGQAEYDSLAEAEAAIYTEKPIVFSPIKRFSTSRTAIIVKANATDLSDPAQAESVSLGWHCKENRHDVFVEANVFA